VLNRTTVLMDYKEVRYVFFETGSGDWLRGIIF